MELNIQNNCTLDNVKHSLKSMNLSDYSIQLILRIAVRNHLPNTCITI